jgi:hypothetical protein
VSGSSSNDPNDWNESGSFSEGAKKTQWWCSCTGIVGNASGLPKSISTLRLELYRYDIAIILSIVALRRVFYLDIMLDQIT